MSGDDNLTEGRQPSERAGAAFSAGEPRRDPGAPGGQAGEAGAAGDDLVSEPGQAPRGPIVLKVEYKRLNTFFYDYTKNISKGGTFIKTDRPLGVGTVFAFRLILPVTTEPVELRGEVRAVVKPAEASPGQEAGMGIRFVFRDAEERYRLDRKVEKLMVDSLGQLIYSRLLALDGQGPDGSIRGSPTAR
jgi:type IV pilus assembly protein PilZ